MTIETSPAYQDEAANAPTGEPSRESPVLLHLGGTALTAEDIDKLPPITRSLVKDYVRYLREEAPANHAAAEQRFRAVQAMQDPDEMLDPYTLMPI